MYFDVYYDSTNIIKEERERELLAHNPESSLEVIIAMESPKKF